MGWSTREVADLAGTSVRTVRHYHDVGLLAEPDRRANGYKSYDVVHLVRLLRIKRLTGLGLSLAQIAQIDDGAGDTEEVLRALDAELAQSIDRLQRVRVELAQILSEEISADLPSEFAVAANDVVVSEADRSLTYVMSRLMGPAGRRTFIDMLQNRERTAVDRAFDELPADADERMRAELAEQMLLDSLKTYAEHPGMLTWNIDAPRGAHFAERTISDVMLDLYNGAQIDVLLRVGRELPPSPEAHPGGM